MLDWSTKNALNKSDSFGLRGGWGEIGVHLHKFIIQFQAILRKLLAVLAHIYVNLLTLMLGYILDLIINDFQELDFSNLLEMDN